MSDSQGFAAEQISVIVLPFQINAEKDMNYLQKGISDILKSRLAGIRDVKIVSPGAGTEVDIIEGHGNNLEEIRAVSKQWNVDYIVYGSLSIIGKQASLDTKVIEQSGSKEQWSFYRKINDLDEVISATEQIAKEIEVTVFKATSQKKTTSLSVEKSDLKNQNEKKNGYLWRSVELPIQIIGLGAGDIDGDGSTEIVVATIHDIMLLRRHAGQLAKAETFKGKPYHKYLAIDVADINKNGKAEIFVTSENTASGSLESFVLEWENMNFIPIAQNESWYLRIVGTDKKNPQLLGQKKGISDPYMPGIFELSLKNSTLTKGQRVALPNDIMVLGMSIGDSAHDHNQRFVAFDSKDRLCVLHADGTITWKSSNLYGGSEAFILPFAEQEKKADERFFLPQRILMTQINGKSAWVTVINDAISGRLLKRFRSFNRFSLVFLSWDGIGLSVFQKTNEISGYVSDFSVADLNNDGVDEVICAIVSDRGGIFSTPKSTIAVMNPSSLGAHNP